MQGIDGYTQPSFSRSDRLRRFIWGMAYAALFRPSLAPFHEWRSFLLRLFGATLGPNCHIYPKAVIWAPWNLRCEDVVAVADGATIYNPSEVFLGSHSIVSQEAYLCGASHDYNDPGFPLISAPIRIEAYAWVCARATVQMGVKVSEGAVLALGSVATKDLEAWHVYAGLPARKIKMRQSHKS